MAASRDGYLLMAQTFFSDMQNIYSGTANAGYHSYVKRPFANFTIFRNSLSWGPWHRLGIWGGYNPEAPLNYSQDRFSTGGGADSFFDIASTLRSSLSLELNYLSAKSAGPLSAYRYLSPGLKLSLRSPKGHDIFENLAALPKSKAGFFSTSKVRLLKEGHIYQSVNLHTPLGSSEFQAHFEYGKSGLGNFPAAYFEWGGLYPLSTLSPTFLSRGFAPRIAAVPEIVRGNLEWGATLAHINRSVSWNRLRVNGLEARGIFETLSWDSYTPNARFRLGRQYFSSAGTEIDLNGQVFHYVIYKLSLGIFHGFGAVGENRATISLRSFLDL